MFEIDKFRPTSGRRRLLIVLLAIAMGVAVMWAMTRKWGVVRHAVQHPADVADCAKGQSAGCVGSMTAIIAAPPAEAASR